MARRSARLSKAKPPQSPKSSTRSSKAGGLGSLLESDEFRDAREHQSPPDDKPDGPQPEEAVSSSAQKTTATATASSIKTPKTESRPSRGEMHPKTVHATTAEPDSGFKLGFVDIGDESRRQSTGIQGTPSRVKGPAARLPPPSPHTAAAATAPTFQFTFNSDSHLSQEAREMMAQVRADAAKIKVELAAEREAQDRKDQEAEHMLERKIAKPRSKAGRFSDVHMAQFRKMDSIANHPSAFRAKPGYTRPTAQSLKRSPSKAELDAAPERPRTAGKSAPGRQVPAPSAPTLSSRPVTAGPDKPLTSPAKRVRRSEFEDASATRPAPAESDASSPAAAATLSKSKSSSTLFSPTKASLARNGGGGGGGGAVSQPKASMLPRSKSARSVKPTPRSHRAARFSSATVSRFTSKLLEARQEAQVRATAQSAARSKPLPPLPTEASTTPTKAPPEPASLKAAPFASRLPTLSGLRSILRSPQKTSGINRGSPANLAATVPESAKKVDFTPSVKSRYAVKLAAASPSPAKLGEQDARKSDPVVPFDPAAYAIASDSDETWDEEQLSSPVDYPVLPPVDADPSFIHKAKDHTRRESREFKSIFTTLHPSKTASASTLTSVNTLMNKTNPTAHANKVVTSPSNASTKPSPATIRHVRTSEVPAPPFDAATAAVMTHGLPAKKRRRPSDSVEPEGGRETNNNSSSGGGGRSARLSVPRMPGRWSDHAFGVDDDDDEPDTDDEGNRRGGKRARTTAQLDGDGENKAPPARATLDAVARSPVKRSAAREQAAQHARDRKSTARGKSLSGLTMSRLNALARPKSRG